MDKKKLWVIIMLILLVAGVTAFLFWPKSEPPSIKIWSYPIPLATAIERGFFEEEGLRIEFIEDIAMPIEDAVLALQVDEIDYIVFNGMIASPIIEASLRNAPIKTIMLLDRIQTLFLVAQPELEKLNDLKTVGVPSLYTPLYYYHALKFVEEYDLEVEIIVAEPLPYAEIHPIGQVQDWLLKGEVDAVLIGANAYLLQAQGFPILATLDYMLPSGLSVRNDKIEENPEEVQKIIRALERTMEFIVTKPEEEKRFQLKLLEEAYEKRKIAEKDRPDLPELIEWLYPHYYQIAFDRSNIPADEGAELLIQIVKAGRFETIQEVEKQIVTSEDLQKVFDFRFVK